MTECSQRNKKFIILMAFPIFLLVIISIFWICIFALSSSMSSARRSSKLPPGPFPFPIIGNILHLGPKPHQSLAKLSVEYGPLMSLKLGNITTIVVSSPEMAKILLQKHDIHFCNRTVPCSLRYFKHDKYSVVWLPVENQWRKLRKIMKEQMFSIARLDASQGLRREKLQKLFDYLKQCSEMGRAVDIGIAAFTTTLNLMSASLFSMEFAQFNSGSSQEMKDLMCDVMRYAGRPNLTDFFPILESIDPQGISKQLKIRSDKLFAIFDKIIDEKINSRGQTNDLVDALIDMNQRDETELSRYDIKHMLLDLFVAGTETSSGTVEWAMTELLRNPDKMSKLTNEIKDFIQQKGQVEESDIASLPYLQAVVKETFRLHTPGPFLVPRKAESDIEINGYLIPKNAHILTNVWAWGRDPNIWTNADLFLPERFLTGKYDHIDFKGHDFELIPFGAGRRICPGLPLAYRMVPLMLARFVGNFGWKLEQGIKPEELDMDEKFGITLLKVIPLKAVPVKL